LKIIYPSDPSSASLRKLIDEAGTDVVFIGDSRAGIEPGPRMFDRMSQIIRDLGAGIVFSDGIGRPRIDYQSGSIRDNFDFGPVVAVSVMAARPARLGADARWGGMYALRLRISESHPIVRIPEPLYEASVADARPSGQKQFDYVDPRNRD